MDDIISELITFWIGISIGVVLSVSYMHHHYIYPMNALGIEKFQKCEINTTNCHSNWYEIVWKKDRE